MELRGINSSFRQLQVEFCREDQNFSFQAAFRVLTGCVTASSGWLLKSFVLLFGLVFVCGFSFFFLIYIHWFHSAANLQEFLVLVKIYSLKLSKPQEGKLLMLTLGVITGIIDTSQNRVYTLAVLAFSHSYTF